ncbi:MAG: ligase-associated DNA damage response exonuclease [Flavobacteriales bacterium]|nr:ligase-associated DNA damage response exonuclease [Flavobacteriales bacterium]
MIVELLEFTSSGIYCEKADVYIDPWRKVPKALITHGHADHARSGMGSYLASEAALPVMRHRLGTIDAQGIPYGREICINGVKFSFHPAGHLIGSSQIRVEHKGEVWVASGDYKVENDGITEAFEPVPCHTFITECTFGLPVFDWRPQAEVFEEIHAWWRKNQEQGKVSVLVAYSLGKAQRVIHNLDGSIGPILTHGAVENINEVLRAQGIDLQDTRRVTPEITKEEMKGALVIGPSSILGNPWLRKFSPFETAMVSGWMAMRGNRRRRALDRGFVLSDHADWKGLNQTIESLGCERVITTHGYSEIYARYLRERGLQAQVESTEYEGDQINENEGS